MYFGEWHHPAHRGDSISQQGRSTQGVRVMDLRAGDTVASVAVIREGKLSRVEENGQESGPVANGDGQRVK
jgi:DNA gyrase/topoisomerase IV subunit A